MSRIGKMPITVPAGVTVNVDENNLVTVKGPKGTLTQQVNPDITLKQEGNVLTLERPTDSKPHKAMHGLYRALVHNMVVGVTDGFSKTLEMVGTGYRARSASAIPWFWKLRKESPMKRPTRPPSWSRAAISSRSAILPRTFAPFGSLNPIWARASSTRMSISAARKARPASKRGSDCRCLKNVTGMRFA